MSRSSRVRIYESIGLAAVWDGRTLNLFYAIPDQPAGHGVRHWWPVTVPRKPIPVVTVRRHA